MSLPFSFANATQAQGSWLDQNFSAVGVLGTIPCSVSGTNTITLSPLANTPTISAYSPYLRLSGIVAVSNTGPVNAALGSLGSLPVYKDTSSGPALLVSGDLPAGNALNLVYDPALGSGGGFHGSTSAPPSGVSGITAGTGIASTGGTTPTISLAAIATLTVLANLTGGSSAPIPKTMTQILDAVFGNTQGGLLYRNASAWTALSAGVSGQQLTTTGASANPQWGMTEGLALAATGSSQTDALVLTTPINEVTSVSSGTGVILPALIGTPLFVFNRGVNTLKVYPTLGAAIDGNSVNASVNVSAGDVGRFVNTATAQFYSA